MPIPFTPSPDVAAIVQALLDLVERRDPRRPIQRAIRVRLEDLVLPGYFSQVDPIPRHTAHDQLAALAQLGYLQLAWQAGQEGHLLASVTLMPEQAPALFPWLGRDPLQAQRSALADLLLGDRFRLPADDWRLHAVDHTLRQLRAGRSPAPFLLADPGFNRDLLAALLALDTIAEETPFRVFSVRTFNDSKAFDTLKGAVATLARRHGPGWRSLAPAEALRELGLVANPAHVFLYGPWRLVPESGEVVDLAPFHPAVGIPAALAAAVAHVTVDTGQVQRVVCVENLAAFYELIRCQGQGLAALCLWGNPAPPVRHLLGCLAEALPAAVPLGVWADIDYGGLNILATLRRQVSPRFQPILMDSATLDVHARWAKPLTPSDQHLLARLGHRPLLADVQPLVEHMLRRGLKLEQEAIQLAGAESGSHAP